MEHDFWTGKRTRVLVAKEIAEASALHRYVNRIAGVLPQPNWTPLEPSVTLNVLDLSSGLDNE